MEPAAENDGGGSHHHRETHPWRLRDFHWGIDGRGLVLILDDAGVRQRRWIAWLDLRSGTLTRLTPELAGDPQYVGQVGADGPRILIAIADAATARSELQEVTDTGEVMSRWPGPGQPVSSWVATGTQVVAARTTGSTSTWWHSPLPEVHWSPIAEMPAGDGHLSHPIAFSGDGGSLYAISSAGRDTLALVEMRAPAWSPVVLSAAEGLFAESLELARRTGMKSSTVYALIGLAMTSSGGSDMGRSARLHGAADQALAELGETIEPLEGRLRDLDRQRLRSAMGAGSFEIEYTAGRKLTSEQIVDLALGIRA